MRSTKEKLADRPINSTRLILCEGEDECDLLIMLRDEQGLSEAAVEIKTTKGRDNIENKWSLIKNQANASGITYLAIVFDSEENPAASKQWAEQFVIKHQTVSLKVACFQLPAIDQSGSIESLIRSGIAPTSVGFDCATQWEACVQSKPDTAFKLKAKLDKAWLQVWLTHRTTSTASRIGYAIKNDGSPNKTLRNEIDGALEPLRNILNAVLAEQNV